MAAPPAPGTTPRVRCARALVFALVTTALAVAAHRLAGSMLPGWPVIVGCGAGVAAVAWLLGRHRVTLPRAAVLAVAGQVALHGAFSLSMAGRDGTGMSGMSLVMCGSRHITHLPPGTLVIATHPAASGAVTALAPGTASGSAATALFMLAAHCLAAAGVTSWLVLGERFAARIAATLVACFRLITATLGAARRQAGPRSPRVLPPRPTLLAGGLGRRGPPALAAL